ncbi:MAG: toll/interleukin-1 receptor domain-containing protein [Cyanobacteria bacterium P01_D01_bin.71]
MPLPNSIFISYRRSDSNDIVGRIYDRLREHFGKAIVFKDVDSIPYGDDFRIHLVRTVGQCQVLVAVIGSTWFKTLQERLIGKDQQDWVRTEIETALGKEIAIPVIPLLVGGANMPNENDLPKGLKSLAHRNAIQVRPDPDFHMDLDRLILRLEEIVGVLELATQTPTNGSSIKPEPTAMAIAEPSAQSAQSQSIGNITISGNNNPFNAVQARGDVNISQTQTQTKAANPNIQAALDAVGDLKRAIAAIDDLDETEKAMAAIPVQKLEAELKKPHPDRGVVDKTMATLQKALDGVVTLAGLIAKVAALVAKA